MAGEPRRIIYMNNAATTWPKPPEVMEEVARSLSMPFVEEGRSTWAGRRSPSRNAESRQCLTCVKL